MLHTSYGIPIYSDYVGNIPKIIVHSSDEKIIKIMP